ncbi:MULTISPECIES: DUF6456 domain-containing protein [Falsihalocynthiibacter]|uniref:DUF6456 domain-containing protein n=1 Tax=Falsihalocynthiibacter TaxID=2854182 RepID=UPI0030038038
MGENLDSRPVRTLLPHWVPDAAERYLLHTETGLSIRAVARNAGCHASTVLRQIRRFENRRDDILIDKALRDLGKAHFPNSPINKDTQMAAPKRNPNQTASDIELHSEAQRVLRRLCETGAVLVVAGNMDKAVVLRDLPGGKSARTAIVDRHIAEAMALKEWIKCKKSGKIAQYEATVSGRSFLKSTMDAPNRMGGMAHGFAEAPTRFDAAPTTWSNDRDEDRPVKRYTLAESPLIALARRRDKTGKPFLNDDLVAAGERLREDFELAQMGLQDQKIWEQYLMQIEDGSTVSTPTFRNEKQKAAHDRTREALRDLGPGLGHVVLRCCCFLEGIETTEKEMDWAARSGKIVLKIALQRLAFHTTKSYGKHGPMIG